MKRKPQLTAQQRYEDWCIDPYHFLFIEDEDDEEKEEEEEE